MRVDSHFMGKHGKRKQVRNGECFAPNPVMIGRIRRVSKLLFEIDTFSKIDVQDRVLRTTEFSQMNCVFLQTLSRCGAKHSPRSGQHAKSFGTQFTVTKFRKMFEYEGCFSNQFHWYLKTPELQDVSL